MIHWWLPSIVPGCGADIGQEFTGDPGQVTCPACLAYCDQRMAAARDYADHITREG